MKAMKIARRCVSLGFAVLGGLNAQATEGVAPITNDDIVKLVEADVACTIIVTKIRSSENAFDTSADGLIGLTSAGVKEPVVLEMVMATDASGRNTFTGSPKGVCASEGGVKAVDD